MSTFYDNYIKLCAVHDKSPTAVSKEIGLSNAAASGWKNGKKPSAVTKQKLADYFGVTVEELTGEEQKEKPSTPETVSLSGLSPEDAELVQKILNASEAKKNAIRELL
ncbi:helix-turn-helix domain-containing protein [Megasphaera sp.]|uniref:helix-turn-helix domain-containing protein n=1 Tax=Megasphaera sp. TaxID=2023260 RepID=UPI003F81C79F